MPAAFVTQEQENPRDRDRRQERLERRRSFDSALTSLATIGEKRKDRKIAREKLEIEKAETARLGNLQERQFDLVQQNFEFKKKLQAQNSAAEQTKALMKFRQARPTEFREAMFTDDGKFSQRGIRAALMVLRSRGIMQATPEDLDPTLFVDSVLGSPQILTDEEDEQVTGLIGELRESMQTALTGTDDKLMNALAMIEATSAINRGRRRGIPTKTLINETASFFDQIVKFAAVPGAFAGPFAEFGAGNPIQKASAGARRRSAVARALRDAPEAKVR